MTAPQVQIQIMLVLTFLPEKRKVGSVGSRLAT